MTRDRTEVVKSYYDEHVIGKLNGFVNLNPRVEAAWKTIIEYAPLQPELILEIGCGIGDVSWRLSNRWPHSRVTGLDISPKSIEIATNLFGSERISFVCGILTKGMLKEKFDLIVLMDVYEHIAKEDRNALHEAITYLLSSRGRIILSFPTPRYLAYLKKYNPIRIQPIDEDIDVHVIAHLAQDTSTDVLLYKEVKIWHAGDYAHAVLAKPETEWTAETYKANSTAISSIARLKRMSRKIFFQNSILSKKTQRIAYIHKKLGKEAFPLK